MSRPRLRFANPLEAVRARLPALPSMRLLAVLAVLVLALAVDLSGVTPVQGQTPTTFVKNTGQTLSTSVSLNPTLPQRAQSFRTGPDSAGYVLTSIGIGFGSIANTASAGSELTVTLNEGSTSTPGDAICTLTDPASFSANALNTFAAPTGEDACPVLTKDTTYFVVVARANSNAHEIKLATTGSESEDTLNPATGWTIGNNRALFDTNFPRWLVEGGSFHMIEVKGLRSKPATGQPRVLTSAEGLGVLFAETSGIADPDGLPTRSGPVLEVDWSYQWIRVSGNVETNIGGDSQNYLLSDADVGKRIKVRVSFKDKLGFAESRTSDTFGPVRALAVRDPSRPVSTLVSNTGRASSDAATITGQYAMGFRLGAHGQGYEISSVSLDLAAVPSSLNVSLWIGGVPGLVHADRRDYKLFDFENPDSFKVGLNRFTAPAWAFAYQNVNYFIVLSDFGASLSINETTSDDEDPGGETGAILFDSASSRGTEREDVLRLAVEGSRRDRGILAATYAQPHKAPPHGTANAPDQETISVCDEFAWRMVVGKADRYLIRGFSFYQVGENEFISGLLNRYDLKDDETTLFSLHNSRDVPGITLWSAPRGATVAGSDTYDFEFIFGEGDRERIGAVLTRTFAPEVAGNDSPTATGVTLSTKPGEDAFLPGGGAPYMAVIGEPLHAMVSNLGQANDGYTGFGTFARDVRAQGFTTGSGTFGFLLRGIGVNVDGTAVNNVAQVPDGPSSVSVAVHADADGEPGRKLFDLVSPGEYAAGEVSFFEAPPRTLLAPNTSYVLVWRHLGGTSHRLAVTSSTSEDADELSGFSIADVFYSGSGPANVAPDPDGKVMEIAIYGEALETPPILTVPGDHHEVTRDWIHIPDGTNAGYQFRVVFVTHRGTDANSVSFQDYDAFVQWEAAQSYNDGIIRRVAPEFKAVVCTESTDAREHTGMTVGFGVPIHWLDGGWEDRPTLIAHSYGDFYDGDWVNSDYGAYVIGNSAYFYPSHFESVSGSHMIWTGCDAAGAAHPLFPMGSGEGSLVVAVGTPRDPDDNNGPLGAVDVTEGTVTQNYNELRQLYAISPIFTVVGDGSPYTFWKATITVGTRTNTRGVVVEEFAGYDNAPRFGRITGPTEFTYADTAYHVGSVRTYKETTSNTVTADSVVLELPTRLPVAFELNLALELNGTRLLLSEAEYTNAGYEWDNPGLTWDDEDSVEVKLIDLRG